VKILYAALKYDYGDPRRGLSFEHYNFFDSLLNMGHDLIYFDFASMAREHGRVSMNRRLLELVTVEKPDVMFSVLFREEFDPAVIQHISDNSLTTTVNWFCDDHWRFDAFSSRWAPKFNWAVTTAASALPKYSQLGLERVIKSQWACNHFLYRKMDLPEQYDATFVGMPHGDRPRVVQLARDAGIDVRVWGKGWSDGRLSQEEMIRLFSQSRINLNLSNSSSVGNLKARMSGLLQRRVVRLPISRSVRGALLRSIARLECGTRTATTPYTEQIKGRNFEIPGCGGFTLTGLAENLSDYYTPGRDIASFATPDELVRQLRYYLAHPDERRAIAESGYQRTLAAHTYVHRFVEIFKTMGFASQPASELIAASPGRGDIFEVA
jgi:spore maturation protein CgeB